MTETMQSEQWLIPDKSGRRRITALCAAVYFTSYFTRFAYSCVMVEIIRATGTDKVAASAALTALFITYGVGQLISGWMGDRISPKWLMTGGLLISALMNLLIPFCSVGIGMTIIWAINGFAQSMLWPPLVRVLTERLNTDDYKRATVRVSWASSGATMMLYLVAPFCIRISGWKLIFFIGSALGLLVSIVWFICFTKVEKRYGKVIQERYEPEKVRAARVKNRYVKLAALLSPILLAIISQGLVRDGATTWMPTYVTEIFHWESSSAILTGVAMPIFCMICFEIVLLLNRHLVRNELLLAAIMFFGGVLSFSFVQIFGEVHAVLSVFFFTFAVGCMHGVNQILICMLPTYFKRFGKVSLFSGILNACTYVGSSISAYGVAVLAERSGWNAALILWLTVSSLGVILCLATAKRWKKFKED